VPFSRQKRTAHGSQSTSRASNSSREYERIPSSLTQLVSLPSIVGADTRLTPNPMTIASPARSRRTPATFAPRIIRSFGHLSFAGSPTDIKSARPAASDKPPNDGSSGRTSTRVDANRFPGCESHRRPSRPRPAVCRSATSQSPSRTSPRAAIASMSALVEPVSATRMIVRRAHSRQRRLHCQARGSGDSRGR
jgi:hypothetical protein